MDSKRFNIYAGSVLGAVLLFLLLSFFSQLIFVGPEHAGHEEEVLAFAVPIEEAGEAGEPEEVDLAALVADADPGAGERVFNKCKACHTLEEGRHGVGPSLHGVVGSDIAAADGFSYSDALAGLDGAWDLDHLAAFLENPQGYAPGTKMSFAGLPDPEDQVNVIVYLNEAGGSPIELVSEETAAAEATTEPAAEGEAAPVEGEETTAEGEETTETGAAEPPDEQSAEQPAEAPAEAPAETSSEETGQPAEAEDGEYAELLAAADAENGQKVYRKCQACHTLDEGVHRVGPSLHGVVGREAGAAEGFNYSDAMQSFEGAWTLGNLDAYLENPKEFIPGNKMTFPGLRDAQDRIDVITFINEADGSPEPLR